MAGHQETEAEVSEIFGLEAVDILLETCPRSLVGNFFLFFFGAALKLGSCESQVF